MMAMIAAASAASMPIWADVPIAIVALLSMVSNVRTVHAAQDELNAHLRFVAKITRRN